MTSAYFRAYKARQRELWRATGRCEDCGRRRLPNRRRCGWCLIQARERVSVFAFRTREKLR
jgi:uncharacterized OB-fold protein